MQLSAMSAGPRVRSHAANPVLSVLILSILLMTSSTMPDAVAQVTIRERVEIVPMTPIPDAPAGDSSWAMPQSGTLQMSFTDISCVYEKFIVTSPVSYEWCGGGGNNTASFPDTYPAGSLVSVFYRIYEGYPSQEDIYPTSIENLGNGARFFFGLSRHVTVTVSAAPCLVDPCQGTMTTTVTDRPTSTPRDCEGAGGIAYPNWNPPPYEYEPPYNVEVSVCEGVGYSYRVETSSHCTERSRRLAGTLHAKKWSSCSF